MRTMRGQSAPLDLPAVLAVGHRDLSAARTLTAGANVTVTDNGPGSTLVIAASGGVTDHGALTGLSDADHVAGSINFTATNKLLGRSTAGAGAGEEIACTSAGRALLDDATAADQRATLGLGDSATKNVGTGAGDVAAGSRGVTNGDSHDHQGGDGAAIAEAALSLADNTTCNVSTSKHGFCPKAPNVVTQFLRGDGAWGTVAASTGAGLALLDTVTVAGSAAQSITLTGTGGGGNLDSDVYWLILATIYEDSSSYSTGGLKMFCNSDATTETNYYSQTLRAADTTLTGFRSANNASIGAMLDSKGIHIMIHVSVDPTSGYPRALTLSSAGDSALRIDNKVWTKAADTTVTQLVLYGADTNPLGVGSTASLYRILRS